MRPNKDALYLELLALRCRRGDRAALEELVRTWEKRLFYFIRRLVNDEEEAWDVLQKTWVRVVRSIGSLREPAHLAAWLYRIARNTAINHGHLQATYQAALAEYQTDKPVEEDTAGRDIDNVDQLHRGLARLSLPHREVLTLHFLEDMGIDDVADVLEIPAGTVKSRLHHAKRALRALLEKEE